MQMLKTKRLIQNPDCKGGVQYFQHPMRHNSYNVLQNYLYL